MHRLAVRRGEAPGCRPASSTPATAWMPRSCRSSTMPQWPTAAAGRHLPGNRTQATLTPSASRSGSTRPAGTQRNPGSSAFKRTESPVPVRPAGVRQASGRRPAVRLAGRPAGVRQRADLLDRLKLRCSELRRHESSIHAVSCGAGEPGAVATGQAGLAGRKARRIRRCRQLPPRARTAMCSMLMA
jgi:hypothetical protein